MIEILGLSLPELEAILKEEGFPKFRAKQIMDYLYKRYLFDFSDMLQLPKDLRQWLMNHCCVSIPTVKAIKKTSKGDTIKLLLSLKDDSLVETVLMKQDYGNSICVSSQVGCAMGCHFCASTTGGLYRNLEVHEIVAQGLLFCKLLGEDLHSLVVMGAGEPMQNYDNVIKALRFFHEKESFHMGYRRMTLSTCGLVEGIHRLKKEGIPLTLALSLHAPNEEIRQSIMPIARHYKLDDVLQSMKDYFMETGRRITFEYILIEGVNSSKNDAHQLSQLLKDFKGAKDKGVARCNINLIPVNGNEHNNFYKPKEKEIKDFVLILEKEGYTVIVRKEMGDEIQAACGQLKVQYSNNHA